MDTLEKRNGGVNTTAGDPSKLRADPGAVVDRDQALDAYLDRRDRAQRLIGFYGQVERALGNPRRKGGL